VSRDPERVAEIRARLERRADARELRQWADEVRALPAPPAPPPPGASDAGRGEAPRPYC